MLSLKKLYKVTGISLLVLLTVATRVEADPATLYIKNGANVPIDFTVVSANSCYQGPGIGDKKTIKAYASYAFGVGRNSAVSGCTGAVCIDIKPANSEWKPACFHIHGGGGITQVSSGERPNQYEGKFVNAHGKNIFTTARIPPAVKPDFEWRVLCPIGRCEGSTSALDNEKGNTKTLTKKELKELSTKQEICAKAGGQGAVYSAEVNACYTQEGKRVSEAELGQSVSSTTKSSKAWTFSISQAWLREHEVSFIYYYVEKANKGNGWTNQPGKAENDFSQMIISCPKGTNTPKYGREAIPKEDNCARKN